MGKIENMKTNETTFNSLTPDILENNKKVYTEALDYAFGNPDIRNIAITGIYGAGKSSVWNTYKNNKSKESKFNLFRINPFKNVITVCLGKYSDKNDKTEHLSKNELDSRVETQIINQILSQIKADDIPLSKYKFKGNISSIKLFLNIFLTMFFIGSISIFGIRKEIVELLNKKLEWFDMNILLLSISGMIFVSVGVFLYHFYKENKVKFSKVNFKVAEAQFSDDNNDETVLERDIREIVYLLSSSKSDIVVFEDLDRYDNVDIFIKLKELNFLLNSYLETNKKNRVVKFVYLIKDGLFQTKDRTKFFDFILPIVPVVDSNTSEGHLLDLLGMGNEKQENAGEQNNNSLNKNVLRNVSLYIDDMRILRNIVNEYIVYSKILRVSEEKLDENKLFSLITVKNTYPNEFDLLQEDKGYISGIFKNLEDYRFSKTKDLNTELLKYVSNIESVKNSLAKSNFEVLALGIPSYIRVDTDQKESWPEFLEKWSENPEESKRIFDYHTYDYYVYDGFLKTFIDKLDEKIELGDRITQNREEQLNKLIEKKDFLERQIEQINLYTFKELFSIMSSEDIEKVFECKEGTEKFEYPLIRYLLIEGLFDETYWYYNGNFDDTESNTLKSVDRIYMRRLLENSDKNILLEIESPNEILNRLTASDFKRSNILNYKLLEECVKRTYESYNSEDDVLNMLSTVDENGTHKDLVEVFEEVQFDTIKYCVNLLILNKKEMLKEVIKICKSNKAEILNNITLAIMLNGNVSKDTFEDFRKDVEKNEKLIEIVSDELFPDVIDCIQAKGIRFENLQNVEWNNDRLLPIVNQKAYKLSIDNLIYVTGKILKKKIVYSRLIHFIYTKEELHMCKEYIDENFEDIVSKYIESNNTDVIYLTNKEIWERISDSKISNENKIKYLNNSYHTVEDLSYFEGNNMIEIAQYLFKKDKVRITPKNLDVYWSLVYRTLTENTVDAGKYLESFIRFMNGRLSIGKGKSRFVYGEKSIQEILSNCDASLCNFLINDSRVNIELFKYLINYATDPIKELSTDIQDVKIKDLIDKNMIEPNEFNIRFLIEKSLDEEIKTLAEENEKEVLPILENMELSDETIYSIVNANISTDNAKSLLTKLKESVQIDNISPEKTELIEYIQNENL